MTRIYVITYAVHGEPGEQVLGVATTIKHAKQKVKDNYTVRKWKRESPDIISAKTGLDAYIFITRWRENEMVKL